MEKSTQATQNTGQVNVRINSYEERSVDKESARIIIPEKK